VFKICQNYGRNKAEQNKNTYTRKNVLL